MNVAYWDHLTDQFLGPKSSTLLYENYYHGLWTTEQSLMNELVEDGDFLVRATNVKPTRLDLILSLKSSKLGILNIPLIRKNEKWRIGIDWHSLPEFDCIQNLVLHYRSNPLTESTILKRGVERPRLLYAHNTVTFDAKKDYLGGGNFGSVYKAKFTGIVRTGQSMVVKLSRQANQNESVRAVRTMMKSEAGIMYFFEHRNVIKLEGIMCFYPPIMLMMELCPGGSLDNHLQKYGDSISNGERLSYALDAARGIRYLHYKGCVHRDIAARNCLISCKGFIKISDFGLSQFVGDGKEEFIDDASPKLPVRWMAPESLKRPRKFSKSSDVWSFGVLMFEIMNNGEKLWIDWPNKKIATYIRKGMMPEMPSRTPPKLKEMVDGIWVINPLLRPEMGEICVAIRKMIELETRLRPQNYVLNKLIGVQRSKSISV